MKPQIIVRDKDNFKAALVKDFESLTIVEKHAGISTWELTLRGDLPVLQYLLADFAGIIVITDDGVFSGRVLGAKRDRKGLRGGAENHIILSGCDDTWWTSVRRAEPSNKVANYNGTGFYHYNEYFASSGSAEFVMKNLVSAQLGSLASSERRVPNLVVATSAGRGPQVLSQARFDLVSEVLTKVSAAANGMGFYIRQLSVDSPVLTFDIYEPRDVSAEVIFSYANKNVAEDSYESNVPTETSVLAAGQGEGAARDFWTDSDAAGVRKWGWIEGPLVDRRDSDDLPTIKQEVAENLIDAQGKVAIDIKTTAAAATTYNKSWRLGDSVGVALDGLVFSQPVQQVERTYTSDELYTVRPLIGSSDAPWPGIPKLFSQQRALSERQSQLERRL